MPHIFLNILKELSRCLKIDALQSIYKKHAISLTFKNSHCKTKCTEFYFQLKKPSALII